MDPNILLLFVPVLAMNAIAFHPKVDIPLTVITVVAFIANFIWWAKSDQDDTTIDLEARLPTAIAKVVVLFSALLLICWLANLALWSTYVCLILVSCIGTILAANNVSGDVALYLAAGIIREWCFGFPLLILQPPEETESVDSLSPDAFVGCCGIAASVLRPTGRVVINGEEVSATSEDGSFIELGASVAVTSVRNGQYCVRVVQANEDSTET